MDSEFDEEFLQFTAASPVGKVVTSFGIPLLKTTRYVWVALDVAVRATETVWLVEGELRFTKFGSPVLTIPLMRGNSPGNAMWPTTQTAGGSQPGIYYGSRATTPLVQQGVEIPCWAMEVEADLVELFLKSVIDAAGTSNFVSGLRIQSQ